MASKTREKRATTKAGAKGNAPRGTPSPTEEQKALVEYLTRAAVEIGFKGDPILFGDPPTPLPRKPFPKGDPIIFGPEIPPWQMPPDLPGWGDIKWSYEALLMAHAIYGTLWNTAYAVLPAPIAELFGISPPPFSGPIVGGGPGNVLGNFFDWITESTAGVMNLAPGPAGQLVTKQGDCTGNRKHVLILADAFSCCRKQLLAVERMTGRFADFWQGLCDLQSSIPWVRNKGRNELLTLFDGVDMEKLSADPERWAQALAPGVVNFKGIPALKQPGKLGMDKGARNLVIARNPKPGMNSTGVLIPWQLPGWSESDDELDKDDGPKLEAIVVDPEFWNDPEATLQTATSFMRAVHRAVRRRVKADDCCACMRKLIRTHRWARKSVKGPVRLRKKGLVSAGKGK